MRLCLLIFIQLPERSRMPSKLTDQRSPSDSHFCIFTDVNACFASRQFPVFYVELLQVASNNWFYAHMWSFGNWKSMHSEKIFDWIKKIICLKHFLWWKEMFCFNETKFAWFKWNIFGLNKYLFVSSKFLPQIK